MAQYDVKVRVTAESEAEVREIGGLVQNALNVVENKDMIKLLAKVKSNPKIVKTALKFI